MKEYADDMRGTIFANDNPGDGRPPMLGVATIGGCKLFLSVYPSETNERGHTYFPVRFSYPKSENGRLVKR